VASLRAWLWALLKLRAAWPVPGLILLAVLLPFLPLEAWRPQFTTRRTLSKAELAILISGLCCVMYWLVLLLGRLGLLNTRRGWGMKEPSEMELAMVEAGLRWACLIAVYLGPLMLIWKR
jgi:hypothetical protein